MESKGTYLFDINKLLPRPLPVQEKFERDYYDFLSVIPDIIDQAFEMTVKARRMKDPRAVNRNWFANEMSGNLAFLIMRKFPAYVKMVRGTYCLNLNFEYECYVKRLTSALQPSYRHSDTSWANFNQRAMSIKEQLPIIYIGYKASKTNDKILGSYAVCLQGKNRLWVSDLNALTPPSYGTASNVSPVTPQQPEVAVGVRIKKKAK